MFQSTHPVWGATSWELVMEDFNKCFNPRTPCGVRLDVRRAARSRSVVSIHAPRVGCDDIAASRLMISKAFQSTHPVWGATCG